MTGLRGLRTVTAGIVLAGVALVALALATDSPRLAWSWLVAYASVLLTALGCLGLLLVTRASNGEWFAPYRRLAVIGASALPALAVLFVPLLFWRQELYPWAHLGAVDAHARAILTRSGWWLTAPAFAIRAAACLTAWVLIAAACARRPRGSMRFTIAALLVFVLTLTLAAVDWFMGTVAPWRSTIYPVSIFATAMIAGLALLAAVLPAAERRGLVPGLTAERRDALGRLLVTFLLFRAYTGYSQLNIMWSADVPAEATWYLARIRGPWRAVGIVMLAGHAVAFLALLLRRVRRDPTRLSQIGCWLLVMHVIDVYWLLMPDGAAGAATPRWPDLAALLLVTGLALGLAIRRLHTGLVAPAGGADAT